MSQSALPLSLCLGLPRKNDLLNGLFLNCTTDDTFQLETFQLKIEDSTTNNANSLEIENSTTDNTDKLGIVKSERVLKETQYLQTLAFCTYLVQYLFIFLNNY
ncbi:MULTISPECIES: hypothetical protein [Nostoc]|uniref:Uncharacterized protein n=1 Tax=Nostoc paludosum FACHB-159 TaxID=2692908 RepID=A0ABR8KEE3_9NOSO|nr:MULTISPECIES: hypothetical protein [Nostoc]MBD2679676.1 hypothetical protein [Nostoc sp. FACHB-857]MBD2736665.1 hypothetical protein [Nostoc paludosum FACHB-159]